MQPLEVFPRLVWEKILEKIEDPYDKLMILDCHPQLEKEFGFEKDQWQFPAILPILFDSFNLNPHLFGQFFFQFAEKKEAPNTKLKLLTCRSVSSLSLKAIDKYLDSYWKHHLAPPSCITHDSGSFFWIEEIDKFEKNYPMTSIIGKVAKVAIPLRRRPKGCGCCHGQERDDDHHHPMQFEEKRTELLKKIGKTLRGLDIYFAFERSSELIDYPALLLETLEFVPNLETLKLEWCDDVIDDVADMEKSISLPILPKVTRLGIQSMIGAVSSLKRLNVLQYFPQLTKLDISLNLWKPEYNNAGLFPNLKFLYMVVCLGVAGEKEEFEIFFERLDMPKLKQMRLVLYFFSYDVMLRKTYEDPSQCAHSVKDTAIKSLRMKYPNPGWKETWEVGPFMDSLKVEFNKLAATAAH